MGRLTGAIASLLDAACVAHLRDIIRLSRAAVADLNRNRRLLAVSRATRDSHVAAGLQCDRVRVVYNGIDCDVFQPRLRAGWLRAELGLPASAFLIAAIGQIGIRKGQDVLANAAAQLANRLSDAHFVLVGERNSGKREAIEFETNVVEQFHAAGLSARFQRLGYRDDIPLLLNEVDLVVHPARQEPLGRVLLEAAAAGCPIIATDVGGTAEILEHGHSAILVPPDDAQLLAEAIAELHDDAAKRKRYAEAARERVVSEFSIASAARTLADAWNEVLMEPA
jgi:glycosyltransferase involved in cell wall biosynthesis